MKPQHSGSNYKTLRPFFQKMEQTGRNIFKAGLGGSRIIIEDMNETFRDYGHVFRLRYLNEDDRYYEIAMNDDNQTVTPLRYIDENAISMDNTVPDLKEVNCFWFSWKDPCPKPEMLRKVDAMLWGWLDYLVNDLCYNVKYA